MKSWKLLSLVVLAILTGCTGQSGTSLDDEFDEPGASSDSGTSTFGEGDSATGSAVPIGDDRTAIVMNERVIYFAYDSAQLDDASIALLKQHGRYLAENPGERARLEGHADERGSREYNIGLGERRAVTVQSLLLAQGAAQNQLTAVSFGEERPAELGMSESAWSKNRRVEIVYQR